VKLRYVAGVVLSGLLLVLTLAACGRDAGSAADGSEEAEDTSPMIFRVADTTVTEQDYRQRLEETLAPAIQQMLAQGQTREQVTQMAEEQDVRQSILEDMIQQELLLWYARQEGIGVDAEQVDQEVQRRQDMLGTAPDEDGEAIEEGDAADTQATEVALREEVSEQQLVLQVIANNTTADMFNSKHILVEEEETAEEVLEKLEAGEDFGELAAEYSQDPGSAQEGGEYGWIPRGSFVPEYEEAAFSAELNEPVIVESQFGYHVIVVEDREEDRAFEDIEQLSSAQNAQMFYEETFVPWYDELRAEAEESGVLEVNEEFDPTSVPLPFPDEDEMPPTMEPFPTTEAMPTPEIEVEVATPEPTPES
jgi:peptidyl-prolyl cis-trans isomerase C